MYILYCRSAAALGGNSLSVGYSSNLRGSNSNSFRGNNSSNQRGRGIMF